MDTFTKDYMTTTAYSNVRDINNELAVNSSNFTYRENNTSSSCYYERNLHIEAQYWIITVGGMSACVLGVMLNTLVFAILARLQSRYTTDKLYLMVLCVLDMCIEVSYVLTFPIGVYAEYHYNEVLYAMWHRYLKYVYTSARISMAASSYVIVTAAIERYVVAGSGPLGPGKPPFPTSTRVLLIITAVALALFLQGSVFFELEVLYFPWCVGLERYAIGLNMSLKRSYFYNVVFAFWVRGMMTTIAPFGALIALQTAFWLRTKRQGILQGLGLPQGVRSLMAVARKQRAERRTPAEARSARRMIISVVISYMVCQSLQIVITVWEFADMNSLRATGLFYSYATDAISILTLLQGTARMPIYYVCNDRFRREFKRMIVRNPLLRRLASVVTKRSDSYAWYDSTVHGTQDQCDTNPFAGMAGIAVAKITNDCSQGIASNGIDRPAAAHGDTDFIINRILTLDQHTKKAAREAADRAASGTYNHRPPRGSEVDRPELRDSDHAPEVAEFCPLLAANGRGAVMQQPIEIYMNWRVFRNHSGLEMYTMDL